VEKDLQSYDVQSLGLAIASGQTGEGKVSEEWVGEASVLGFRICHGSGKGRHSKSLTGALQIDGAGCTFSVSRELRAEILA